MKRYFTVLAGMLLAFTSSRAQQAPPSEIKEDQRSLLWKITGKDMKAPSYLFGTIHLLCQKDYVWTPVMKKSLRSCKEVCFEMDMDDPSVMMEVATGMIDRSGKSLKEYFTEEDYKIVKAFVTDSLGMSIEMFQQMKPAALQTLFSTKAVSCSTPVSYETNILEEARKYKMEVTGLEEAREQLELFDRLPQDSVIKELVSLAKDYSGEAAEYRRMLRAYKRQDLPLLAQIIDSARTVTDDLNAFLDDRNIKWIGRMEERMDQKPVFFAVGAGHLLGEKGLITLLREAGYVIVPVKK